jgi:hypothetical protein
MSFQLYQRDRATDDEETVSISSAGIMSFSAALTKKYLENVSAVLLYFDPANKRVGIKPAKEEDKFAYKLFLPVNSKRKTVSGRGFLRKYKIGQEKEGKFKAQTFEASFENGMVIFKV